MDDVSTIEVMDRVETDASAYSTARDLLRVRLEKMNTELGRVRAKHLPGLREAAITARRLKTNLEATLRAHPKQFESPRKVQIQGVNCGYQKVKQTVEAGPNTVALIEKHFPEKVETMIEVTRKVIPSSLQGLSPGDRQKLGCTVKGGEDVIVIKPVKDPLNKLLDKILNAPEELED